MKRWGIIPEKRKEDLTMKRIARLAVLVLVSLLVASLFAVSAAELSDIKGHWAEEYIKYGIEQGYISGYEDGTFLPNKTVTRAEFSKMINSAVKMTSAGDAKGEFNDVSAKDWYFDEVKKAENAGYITGYEDGTFRPNNSITRQEAAVILSRIVLPTDERTELTSFADSAAVDSWAGDSVSMIAAKGYIKGDENKNFDPKGALTRSQAAKLICEFVKNENVVNNDLTIKPTSNKVLYSETLFTDDIIIDVEEGEGLTVTFENSRVLGDVIVKVGGVQIDLENSEVNGLSIEADDAFVSLDKASKIKNADISSPATVVGGSVKNVVLDGEEVSVTLGTDCDKVEVKGDVFMDADVIKQLDVTAKSSLVIQAGNIEKLTVDAAAKGSTINLASKVNVKQAHNKAAVTYVGKGTIEKAINDEAGVVFDGITVVETTGKKPTDGEGNATTAENFFENVTVSPADKKSNVSITSKIYITFDEEVFNNEGKKLTAGYVEDYFQLMRGSENGIKTAFSATISSNNKKITLEPSANFKNNTTYYIVIPEGLLSYEDASVNGKYSSYFKTIAAVDDDNDESSSKDDDDDEVEVTFTPGSGDSASVNTEIVIAFSEKVYKTAKKGTLDASYCENTAFEIRKGSSSGDEVPFIAEVASTGKKVTLIPDSMLEPDTKYYVILNKKLYDEDGDYIAKESSYFKTESGLAVSINPIDGATGVSATPEITFEFSETVLNYNEKALSESDIEDAVSIRVKSKTGDEIFFDVEIAESGKMFTLLPDELEAGKKYCIVVEEEAFYGKESEETNEEIISYFTVAAETAPIVTPADGKRYVGVDTAIEVTFTDEIYAYSKVTGVVNSKEKITNENVAEYLEEKDCIVVRRDSTSGKEVKCDVELSSDGCTIILTPRSELAVNKEYYVTVKANAFYVGGTTKKNSSVTTTFSTHEALAPTFSPEDGDKNIEVDASLKITFEESIYNLDGDEVTKTYIVDEVVRLYKKSNEEDVEFGAKINGRVITITPDNDLEGGTEYVLMVNSGTLKNRQDLENQSYSITFKTESKIDKSYEFEPGKKATDVSVDVTPVITFASPIFKSSGGSVTEQYAKDYITLREGKSNGKEVKCTVEFDEEFKEFTIIPEEPLKYNTKYYVVVASGKFEYEDEDTSVSISSGTLYFTTENE